MVQITVSRGNDTNIHNTGTLITYTDDFTILKQSKQVDLHIQWHFSYFIKKNCSAVGELEFSLLAASAGSCERTFHIAEQFTLDKFARQSATVYHNKRLIAAGTGIVERLRKKFLTRSAFSKQHYRRVGIGNPLGLFYHFLY